ncbi:S26 family signal peptidase [Caulobacter sp. 602-2]|uniref:S26 family signal peptidase n=1 Tax=Caulobacter sp. 602-2 TaxID=2710887 RepID=A0A6G4QUM3_9CAUL|nr:S26 family signal peptidase [Caulobacter sp. 602-2]NGM49320.1 S26 family signal peptidase [Caulobacter sp. 602-2]
MRSRVLAARARKRAALLAWAAFGAAIVVAPLALDPAPRLVWNASASAPIGLWRVWPGALVAVGDRALAVPPPAARALAARRGYLPANVPLIKGVAAADGDLVCADGPMLAVNGRPAATRRAADRHGRPLPWWSGCQRLAGGAVLLLNPAPESFDGRYFGPVEQSAIIGKASPLWLP